MRNLHKALLFEQLENNQVKCFLCNHKCLITENNIGICSVRKNISGNLYTLNYGKVISANVDPIEKKPFYHFLPGTYSFSYAAVGCNFVCDFCQNFEISQIPKKTKGVEIHGMEMTAEKLVEEAINSECESISHTYTEPTIYMEYALDVARLSHEKGIKNTFVTNGYMSKEALELIRPYLNAANVDLKSFNDEFYIKHCGARLNGVLETLKEMKKAGIWIEITTLLIPSLNDSEGELKKIAEFIFTLDANIPWHVTGFRPSYNLTNIRPTSATVLIKAKEIGLNAGLKYVYTGNIPGIDGENTYCHKCKTLLIKRYGMSVLQNNIKNSACPSCNTAIEGIFND